MVLKESVNNPLGIPYGFVSFLFGIIAIIESFSFPVGAIAFSVIGLIFASRETSAIAKRGKILNIIGLVVSVIVSIVLIVFMAGGLTGEIY